MESFIFNWYIAVAITLTGTVIVSIYGYLILHAIKGYNQKSLILRGQYEDLKNKQERMLLETEIEIREQTFQFISKEIHDNITQSLSLAQLTLNCLDKESDDFTKKLTKSKEQVLKALNDLNNLSKSLDSDIIDYHGLISSIEFEIERWNRMFSNSIELKVEGIPVHLENNKELFIFRIIQESLSNAIKYSDAKEIMILLEYHDNKLKFFIEDNGIGFDLESIEFNRKAGKMAGLKNMRQRAEVLNGTLSIESTKNVGTKIAVEIPFLNYEKDNNRASRRSQAIA